MFSPVSSKVRRLGALAALLVIAAVVAEIIVSCAGWRTPKSLALTAEQMQTALECQQIAKTCIETLSEHADKAPPSATIDFINACAQMWREHGCQQIVDDLEIWKRGV